MFSSGQKRLGALLTAMAISTGANASNTDLTGTWKTTGYGLIYNFNAKGMQTYQQTDISCVADHSYSHEEAEKFITRIDRSQKDKLSFYFGDGITRYDTAKISSVPANCTDKINKDPIFNFEVFWRYYNNNYAFFELRGIDWAVIYKQNRPKVSANTTDQELFEIFQSMLEQMKDFHVNLDDEKNGRSYSPGVAGTLQKALEKELKDTAKANDSNKAQAYANDSIYRDYLKNTQKQELRDGVITWGWAADNIGYINIKRMWGFSEESSGPDTSIKEIDKAMDKIIAELADAKGIIVDTRMNGGGSDEYALAIAGHLTDQNLLAFTKQARTKDGFAPTQRIFTPSHAFNRFSGPVAYLQGKDTYSAAEIFALSMNAMPNVTSFGESTAGGLSDILGARLPNGWTATMSNELYLAVNGVSYEGRGIPADVEIPIKTDDTAASYLARGMDAAIAFLNK